VGEVEYSGTVEQWTMDSGEWRMENGEWRGETNKKDRRKDRKRTGKEEQLEKTHQVVRP
jgi:hypothetical protein